MNGSYGMETVGSAMPTGRDDCLNIFFKFANASFLPKASCSECS